jgi:hypothetical protein
LTRTRCAWARVERETRTGMKTMLSMPSIGSSGQCRERCPDVGSQQRDYGEPLSLRGSR